MAARQAANWVVQYGGSGREPARRRRGWSRFLSTGNHHFAPKVPSHPGGTQQFKQFFERHLNLGQAAGSGDEGIEEIFVRMGFIGLPRRMRVSTAGDALQPTGWQIGLRKNRVARQKQGKNLKVDRSSQFQPQTRPSARSERSLQRVNNAAMISRPWFLLQTIYIYIITN